MSVCGYGLDVEREIGNRREIVVFRYRQTIPVAAFHLAQLAILYLELDLVDLEIVMTEAFCKRACLTGVDSPSVRNAAISSFFDISSNAGLFDDICGQQVAAQDPRRSSLVRSASLRLSSTSSRSDDRAP